MAPPPRLLLALVCALAAAAVLYAALGAEAAGLLRSAGSSRRLGGHADAARVAAGLAGKEWQRIPPSASAAATPAGTPAATLSGTRPASASSSAPGTPAPSGSGTASRSGAPSTTASGSGTPAASAAPAAPAAPAYAEDAAAMPALYPSRLPVPPPADEAAFESHPPRYLMLVQGQEGFGAWNDQIWEMLDLARTLNRTFVEPCVRNSCLEPCRCGAVHDVRVPDDQLGVFDAGADPLNLRFDAYPCEPYTGRMREKVGWSWPLSAYLDLEALKAYYPHIVRYQDWCDKVMRKDASVATDAKDGRWLVNQGAYCVELHAQWCDLGETKTIGDFYFYDYEFGRPGTVPDAGIMDVLHNEPYHTIFFYGYYRGYFLSPRRGVNVPFHPGHHRAVQHFIKAHFGSAPLTVFHWRSEHVDESMLVPCAHDLAAVVGRLAWPATPSGYRGILMSDMPAPNNRHIMWHTYTSSNNAARHGAMDIMTRGARLLKYDALYNDTDTGVLMIRDFLIGLYADQYITCQGDFIEECLGCFRSNSNFIVRLVSERRRYLKRFMLSWFKAGDNDQPANAAPRLLDDVRI